MKRGCGPELIGTAALLVASSIALHATAQAPAQPGMVDTARGPIAGSTRFIGLGGAFVAIAEDTEGVAINPASSAVRLPTSWHEWDYGLGLDVAIGAWLPHNDIYNAPAAANGKSSALFGSLSLVVNYEHAGFGLAAEAQSNAASRADQSQGIAITDLAANFGLVHTGLAYGFMDGQLLLGAGARLLGMSLSFGSGSAPLGVAAGYEAGFIIKPTSRQYRIGAAVKSPISASIAGTADTAPSNVHVPWEVDAGFAYQFGGRALNPAFVTARQRAQDTMTMNGSEELSKADLELAEQELFDEYQRRPRFYLLLSTELAVIQGGGGHVGIEQFVSPIGGSSTNAPILSPRVGLESEVIPNILRLRGGSYYEPAIADNAQSRIHGTGGFDVRLFEWGIFGLIKPFDWWQLSIGADAARSYLNTSFSIGFWH